MSRPNHPPSRKPRRATDIRRNNSAAVLRLLLDEGPLPRVDIAERLGLTTGAVTRITAEMTDYGLLRELEPLATAEAGRRRVPVDIDAGGFAVVGVHIGLELTTFGLVDLRGRPLDGPHTRRHGPIEAADAMKAAAEATAAMAEVVPPGARLLGTGVISGGFVAHDWQVMADHTSLGWRRENITGIARRLGPDRYVIDNAYRAHSRAEMWFGAARDAKNFIEVFLGNLTGAAVVIDGEFYSGRDARAPEMAHLPVPGRSEVSCSCGRKGCLTSVAGRDALVARARRSGLDVTTMSDITALARAGNAAARRVMRHRVTSLGEATAILVDVYAPEKVVLAGAIRTLDDDVDRIRSVVADRTRADFDVREAVVPTDLGDATTANVVAAATTYLADFYENPLLRSAEHRLGEPAR
ncbi:MAG TPA: ROK family transcriptional regulator [Acidimicrobiia bacterium]|nr:ROK family transcriptional regulator [Acidimicrobiia bacterium]